ncbi:type II secretion system protein N [Pedomonas mirosovicensis]|uniref:type II secretion system protein N n=1 Tax=Pedomonas mirosovicensis TaxID=2908641 RepID=UPI00216A5565|nr:type II secretion system protein N [Pedomonas mirosovicensis]MCH8686338.1 type II secretion system protein N [Pedomonas mirosovicensis]
MKTSRLVGIFLLSFAAFAVARAPLGLVARFAAGDGISYGRAEGTVWSGMLYDVTAGQIPLGDLAIKTAPLSVLALSPRIDWQLTDGLVSGQGEAEINWVSGAFFLRSASVDAELTQLSGFGGTLAATLTELAWGRDGCRAAKGRVRADIMSRLPGSAGWQGPPLAGDISCAGNRLRVALRGRNAGGLLSVRAQVEPGLAYELTALARVRDARLARALPLMGFSEQDENDYRLVRKGTLGQAPGSPERK